MDPYIYAFIGFALSTLTILGLILHNKSRDKQTFKPYMFPLWLLGWAFWPFCISFLVFALLHKLLGFTLWMIDEVKDDLK